MTTEVAEKPKTDRMAKARAAKVQRDNELAEMKTALAQVVEQNKLLTEQVRSIAQAPRMPTTPGPEKKLGDFIKGMRPGESREGIKEVRDSDQVAMEGAFRSGDIVAIKPDTQKGKAWRLVLKSDDPIYGTVLQYLGRTESKRGPRKYKVHFKGVGKDGVTEDEVDFIQSGS